MEILQYPNDALRKICISVPKVTPELADTAREMYNIMVAANGAGLAAPQVGLDIRLVVVNNNGTPLYMFNPVILKKSLILEIGNEGCLSFGSEVREVQRSKEITLRFRDINNKMSYGVYTGFVARVIQHEVDHLQGKLFIDIS